MAKWIIPIEVDEGMLREYYGQTLTDPATSVADAGDFLQDIFAAANDADDAFKLGPENCSVLRSGITRYDDSDDGDANSNNPSAGNTTT
jgi:hypothetical protein